MKDTEQIHSTESFAFSDQVAAVVVKIPEDQLRDAVVWATEYLRQLRIRLPRCQHICAFNMAMDGTCFICGSNTKNQ